MFTGLQTNSILERKEKIQISDISEILKIIKTNKFELHTKLALSIKYLNKIQDIHIPIIEYIRESKEILTALTAISEEKQLYQIWVRYFDITFKTKYYDTW